MTSNVRSGVLGTTRSLLRLLIALNLLGGVLISILLAASMVAASWVGRAQGNLPGASNDGFAVGMRMVMVLGICGVPLAHVVLTRLRDIVDTVRGGDAFIPANAARLRIIAWAVVGLELLHLCVGAVAAYASTPAQKLDIGWAPSLTRWLAVLLLFVLAQVVVEGARMREDLEGTV
jgi:hypothetical protein